MSFDSLLINECDVIAFAETGAFDDYGQPVKTWDIKVVGSVSYQDLPCRHISGKGREVKIGQEVVIIYDELFLNDIDVTEQDRVVINSVTYQILSVLFRQDGAGGHHKQAYLERVN